MSHTSPAEATSTSDIASVSRKKFLDIQEKIECRSTLKSVDEKIKIHNQMNPTDTYSQLTSITSSVWPNGSVLVYEISGFGFESRYSQLNFRYCACFEQGVLDI